MEGHEIAYPNLCSLIHREGKKAKPHGKGYLASSLDFMSFVKCFVLGAITCSLSILH